MKYLLETKDKKNGDHSAAVSFKQGYRMFEKIADLIDHLFENAVFIEKYTIHEVHSFEEGSSESSHINIGCGSGNTHTHLCGDTMELDI